MKVNTVLEKPFKGIYPELTVAMNYIKHDPELSFNFVYILPVA